MKILVIQKKRIGDVLVSSIIFEAIKQKFPDSETHYLIYQNAISVVENNPFIDKNIILNEKTRKSKIGFLKFLFKIRKEKYDVVIDAYGKPNSVIIGWFSSAKKTISFQKSYTKLFYTDALERNEISESNATKALEHRMLLLKPLDIKSQIIAPKIFLTDHEKNIAKQNLINQGIDFDLPIIMISAIGSNESKTYPLEYMAKVLDKIAESKQVQLLFNYVPFQKNDALKIYNLCQKSTQEKIKFDIYENDLRKFLAITSHCCALIGNEGGSTNMAKALSVPTFTIFCPYVIKSDWNMFENTTTNISVHINDYQDIKNIENDLLYQNFKPELFENKLTAFLNFNCK